VTAGSFVPAPGAAPPARRVAAMAAMEFRTLLRNGEQLLLTLVIPVLILVFFTVAPVVHVVGSRVDFLAPGVLALAIMSTAFTGQAIGTGFERRYGVLKRLGATPLARWGLMLGKTLAVLGVEALQVAVLVAVAYALGWHPHGSPATAVLLLVLGTAGFSGLGLLLAGNLRAEATLAGANLIYLVLLGLGGVIFPLTAFPAAARSVLAYLPISALSDGLRQVLHYGAAFPVRDVLTLVVWAVLALVAAASTFSWE
jgi:ABC-2 type transport system permease protein